MYTSCFIGLMLAPVLAVAQTPAWQKSYAGALDVGQKQGRPVAVFVGTGPQGQAALVKEGQFSAETLQILAQKYVCLYLDRAQPGNERLISDLGISKTGLVISDRTGEFQAFHHDGTVPLVELNQQLQRFALQGPNISRTVSNATQRASYYNGSAGQPVSGGTVRC